MLLLSACQKCVRSVSTERWQAVHGSLTSEWTERDGWFWRTQRRVRCYYNDGSHSERNVDGDFPEGCPFAAEQVVVGNNTTPEDNEPVAKLRADTMMRA